MTGGVFSTAIYDPLAVTGTERARFANDTIPATRLDPVGRRLAALYPAPNLAGAVSNYASNIPTTDDSHQGDMRVDHRQGQSSSFFFRYSVNRRDIDVGSVFPAPGNGGSGFGQYPLLHRPRAWSMIGNWTRVFTPALVNEFRGGFTRNESDQVSPADKSLYDEFGIKGVPATPGLTGLPQIAVTGFSALGNRTFTPNPKLTGVYQIIDNASWVRGNHTWKFGFDTRLSSNFAGTSSNARGNITFNGQFTTRVPGSGVGSALADLLLGETSNAQLTSLLTGDLRNNYYGFFVNDTWRLNRKLTLNLGLRYEIQTPFWEKNNRQGNFDLHTGAVVPAQNGSMLSRAFSNTDTNNWAPRLGFAYRLRPSTVIRGATGIFYGGLGYQAIAQMGPANPPYFLNVSYASSNTSSASLVRLRDGFPAGTLDPRNVRNPAGVALLPDFPISAVYQWNLAVQQELPADMVMTVSYVGSSSNYLPGFVDVNDALPGAGAVNARRPFPTYGGITLNSAFAHANYNSLQAKAERRFDKGFSLLASYTYSHGLDNSINGEDSAAGAVTPQNPRNTNAERASSATDIRQRGVFSGIWNLPFVRLSSNSTFRALLGGWQIAGIVTLQTGIPVTPTISPNPANTTGPARPDRIRDGNLPSGQRSLGRWFDPTAFARPANFNFGNSGRHIIRAPGLSTLDGLISRNFRFSETRQLEFRSELYNLSNSAQFGRPALDVATAQAGQITSTSVINRQVQFGLRLVF